MTFDKTKQTINLKDGRALGYADYGHLCGKPVFHFNGSGGSRLEHPPDESILLDLGLRFISTDRPGHGISDPLPDRKLLDWPEDISQLANHLGIEKFYVEGYSAGGPHALVYTVLPWKDSYWGIAGRVYYTLVTLAAVAFVWFLNYWNLLGWRF